MATPKQIAQDIERWDNGDGTNSVRVVNKDGSVISAGGGGGTSSADKGGFTEGTSTFTPSGGVFNDGLAGVTSGLAAWFRITAFRALHINLRDSSGNEIPTVTAQPGTGTRGLAVWVGNPGAGGGGSGTSSADQAAFTAGTTAGTGAMGVFNDALAALASGTAGWLRATASRALHVNLRNNTGTEIGTATTPVRTDPTGTTAQPVNGTVTANIGTSGSLALDATLTGGTAKAIPHTPAKGTTAAGDVTSASVDANTQALHVQLAGTQASVPVSGTVTANVGTTNGLALDATLTGGTQKSIARGGAKGTTAAADVTSTASGANHQILDVAIYDATGNQITSFGGAGGTASSIGSADPTTGTAAGFSDGANMREGRVYDTDGSASAEYVQGANLRISQAAGASIEAKGQQTMANSIPTVLASDQASIPVAATLQAGSAIVGKVGIDQTTPGTTDSITLATGQGAGATIGVTADPAVTTNTTGTLSGKLRGLVAILADVWDSTNHWLKVSVQASTSGGATSVSYLNTAAAVINQNVKATPGNIYQVTVTNASGGCYLRLYDKATAPATTDTPIFRAQVPVNGTAANGAGIVIPIDVGLSCTLGVGLRVTGAAADNDATTFATANTVIANVIYK